MITSVIQERPFEAYNLLFDLRYDLIEAGTDVQRFHATTKKDQPAYSFERARELVGVVLLCTKLQVNAK